MKGSYIKSIREKSGFTQKELSEKMRMPISTIQAWENDKREPLFVNQKALRFWCKKGVMLEAKCFQK